MKQYLVLFVFFLLPMLIYAQDPDGSYNPYVNAGTITPSPLHPFEMNGVGMVSFNIGNSGSDPLEVYTDQQISLTITLSYGEPDGADPIAAIGGSAESLFNWSYSSGTYTAVQNTQLPASYSGTITIAYRVTQNSSTPGSNGFNVNITPAPYQTGSNSRDDDAVSSYTFTEISDFGDAPASYGEASHTLDFSNFLGAQVDGEDVALASANADGDDTDNQDDEDGVVIPAQIEREAAVSFPVTVSGLGYLNAWIDWNGDGDFLDANERIASNVQRLSGTQDLTATVPADAVIAAPTYARFRFSPSTLSSSTGAANGGEVEDYQLSVICAPPDATLSITDQTFCDGSEVTLTAGGGSSYLFRVDGMTVQEGSQNTYLSDSLANGQSVEVVVTDATGCSATSGEITVSVNPLPTPVLTSSDADAIICAGDEISFSASGGVTYDFRIEGSSVQNSASVTYTTSDIANGQSLDVLVRDANGCEALSSSLTHTVNPLPDITLSISDADSAFCAGTTVSFDATGGINYTFRVDGLNVQDGASPTYSTDLLTDGQVLDVIVSDANACVDTSGTIRSTILALPAANAGALLDEICQGTVTPPLGGSVSGSATGGLWSSSDGGSFSPDASTLNAAWIPPAGFNGSATLTLTTTGGECGVATDSKVQVVNESPTIQITNPSAVCSPATVDLTLPSITSGSTSGLVFTYWTNEAATEVFDSPTAAGAGTYYIMGMLPATACIVIAPVSVTVTPTPASPLVDVTDNCDGTSLLSTSASGGLLWSSGETSSSILVSAAGVYTVTNTVDGCTSDAGSGTASPHTAPDPPTLSNSSPANTCPDNTIDLTSLVTSSTPASGALLFKTTNDPGGEDVSNPTAVDAGSYYLFYMDANGCFSTGTAVLADITICPPDLTPTLIVNPNVMHGVTGFDLIVRVTELNNVTTSGQIIVNIPKDDRWTLTEAFNSSLTTLTGYPLYNSQWTYTEDAINHIFTTDASISAGDYSAFGISVSFDPGSTRGWYTITSQLVSGAGGEEKISNNVDSEKIDYFQD